MALQKGDFVEFDYTGRIKETGEVFDTTRADVPHDHVKGHQHEPAQICLGEGHTLKGIDEFLVGKDIGPHTVTLNPEDAFGKRQSQLIQLIQTKKFLDQKIRPVPGGRVNVDGMAGTIRSVSGGRTIVDFNHPLAGKEVEYDIHVTRTIDDKKEQVEALLKLLLHIKDATVVVGAGTATITLKQELPKEIADRFTEEVKRLTNLSVGLDVAKQEQKKTSSS